MNMITPQDMNGNIHLAAVTKNDTNYVLSVLNTASPADLSGSWSSSDLNTISGLNFSDPNDTKTIDCFSLSAIMNQPNFYIVSCVVDSNSTNITNNLYVVNTTETTNVLVVSGEFPYFNGNSTPKQ